MFLFSEVFPPVILNFENQTVYNQAAVELYCNISAHPTQSVQWFKDSYSLEDKIKDLDRPLPCHTSLKQGYYRVKNVVGKLIICSPVDASHTGFYTCSAANRKGKSNATAFLDVLGKKIFCINKVLFYFILFYFILFYVDIGLSVGAFQMFS